MNNLARIQRISLIMQYACTLAALAIPVTLAIMWATFESWAPTHPELINIRPLPSPVPATTLVLGFLIAMIPGGLTIYAVWRLRTLFGLYARGLIFTAENIRCLRGFALAVLGFALAKPISGSLMSVALTMGNPPGQRMLSVSFGSSEATTLFIGCVFLVISWIMDEGRELAEEQAQIV
ncbi:MAG: DUF2975 domain-containing protein [Alphaproteobacteria bacterium]|nr:DUF2975 domain-containing protein [Alphaproteobacteria bacterium]